MRSASIFLVLLIFLLSAASLYDQLTKRIPSRLHNGQAPRSRFGLVSVDGFGSRRDRGGVDVVFVHGLGSNPDTAWQARRNATGDTKERPAVGSSLLGEEHVCWVTDFLPEDIPLAIRENSRVFFYNYDSYWQRDAVQTRLESLGHNMLQSIDSEIRRTEEERSRQLIFIGYSYGGLVVKQALLQASRNRLFENIAEHTQGVLFLGTPHSGWSFSGFGAALARMLRPLGSNPSIADELEYDSARLLDLHREFMTTIADNLRVVNFFETRETNLLKVWFFRWNQFCVEERSATYAGSPMLVQNIGLGVDHYGLNKFGSRTAEYNMIHAKLVELLAPFSFLSWDSVPFHTVSSYVAREEMETRKKVLGPEHPDTLTSMANLASTYLSQGRLKEAEELGVQVMEVRTRVLGPEHPDTLTSMANLASTYSFQGRWKESEELEVQVMEIFKRVLGPEHPSTLTNMANLASTYSFQGRWKEAEELQVQVIKTFKRLLGPEHPSTLTSMANLASTYRSQRRSKEAEELEAQVMEIRTRVLGVEHPDTLTSTANLATTYLSQGRLKEAEELEVQVIETSKRLLGPEHPSTLTSMANLALAYWNQGRWKEAEELGVQVIEIRTRVLGVEHPDTLTSTANLASTYSNQGRLKEAEELEVQVMETRKKVLGVEHPDTLTSMANLAFTWKSQGRDIEALRLMEDCIRLRKLLLGPNHPDTLASLDLLRMWLGENLAGSP